MHAARMHAIVVDAHLHLCRCKLRDLVIHVDAPHQGRLTPAALLCVSPAAYPFGSLIYVARPNQFSSMTTH